MVDFAGFQSDGHAVTHEADEWPMQKPSVGFTFGRILGFMGAHGNILQILGLGAEGGTDTALESLLPTKPQLA